MNCYDCHPLPEPAVAICAHCGKGLCRDHCFRHAQPVHERISAGMAVRFQDTGRTVPRMLCSECYAEVGAAEAVRRVEVRG